MNMIIKRRQLILATLIVALGAAVFVNWYYTGNEKIAPEQETSPDYITNLGEAKYVNATGEKSDYFAEAKLNREKTNSEAMEQLNDSLKNASPGSEEAETISNSINNLTNQIKAEQDAETVINSKLNSQCLVIISGDSAQIVVEKGILNEETALIVMEAVSANNQLDPTKISISEAK